jgi:anti-sigma factor RsiW
MNHQPYETWILDGKPSAPAEKEKLENHLKECTRCARLQTSWTEMDRHVRSTPMKNAPTGFVQNWQNNLAFFKERQKQKQARTLLISFISGALVVLIALGAVLLPKISLISVIVTVASVAIRFMESLKQLWSLILGLMKVAPASTLLVIGAMLGGWILLIMFAWAASVWKVSLKKVVAK